MMFRHDLVGQPPGRFGTPNESYPTPDVRDVLIVEDIPLRNSGYEPIPRGTPRPGDPTAFLVFEQIMVSNETTQFVRRIYATDRANQTPYNFTLKYDGESANYPSFVRSSIIRRDSQAALTPAYGSPLTSVFGILMTSAGAGYVAPVSVSFTGGGGSGAAANVILAEDGSIVGCILTSGGTGYTSAPTISITSSSGTGAAATALVQPSSAILTHQETQSLEQENPQLHALFVRVIQQYETIPGPPVQSVDYDDRGDLQTTITQTVLNTDDPPVPEMNYLFNGASKIAQDTIKSTYQIKTVEKRTPLWIEEAFTTNRALMRHITGCPRTTYTNIVPIGTPAETGFQVTESSVADKNAWEAEQKTTKVEGFVGLASGAVDPQAHGANTVTTEIIVPSGVRAFGTLTLTAQPTAGDAVTINDQNNPAVTLTFSTTAGAGKVIIGAATADTAAALSEAISMAVPLNVLASSDGDVVTVTSNCVGVQGNTVTLATTSHVITLSGATLSGGVQAATTPGGLNILESHTEDLDGTHTLATVKQLAPGEAWPTLMDYDFDPQTKIKIAVRKTVVAAADATDANSGLIGGWYVEFKQVDKFKAVKIESQVVGDLPANEVWYGTRSLSLPDTLLSITPVYDTSVNGSAGDGQGHDTVSAMASAASHSDGEFIITRQHGFKGDATARFTRSYLLGPPQDPPEPLKIFPSYGTAVIISRGQSSGARVTSSADGSYSKENSSGSSIGTRVSYIGPVMTPGITNHDITFDSPTESHAANAGTLIPGPGATASADAQSHVRHIIDIPASSPTALNSGDWFIKEVIVEKWRLGIWVVTKVEVQIP